MTNECLNFLHPESTYEASSELYLDVWRKSQARLSHQWKDAAAMPARLRPTAPMAPGAILVGDPGRALLLAQELLEKPKMSNHARGLWGYTGRTPAGDELTIQATGMGGPSAAIVLTDLVELGAKRVVRVGSCAAFGPEAHAGELLLVEAARATAGSATSFGIAAGDTASPDRTLNDRLGVALGAAARDATVASLDTLPLGAAEAGEATAADMQTLAVFARAAALEIAAAAVLVVAEAEGDERLDDEQLGLAAARAGKAAANALSNPLVEG
jgi:uridine phosphorylase